MPVNSQTGRSFCMLRGRIFTRILHCPCDFVSPVWFSITFIAHYLSAVERRVVFISSRVYDPDFSATSLGRAVFVLFIPRRLIFRQCSQQHIAAYPLFRGRPEGRCRAGDYHIIVYFLFFIFISVHFDRSCSLGWQLSVAVTLFLTQRKLLPM